MELFENASEGGLSLTFLTSFLTCSSLFCTFSATDCTASLKLVPDNVKTLLRRCKAYEGQEKLIEAVDDMKKVVELSPVTANKKALAALEEAQKEQFEKQKEEMMGTLKDLGNKFLGNFGLYVLIFVVFSEFVNRKMCT